MKAADEADVIVTATKLLEEISSDPECGIPAGSLREAQGILIVPHIVENQLGVGRMKGHGVFLSRNEKGEWGDPEMIEVSRLSVGAKAGRKVSDLVEIYRNPKAAKAAEDRQTISFGAGFIFKTPLRQHSYNFSGPLYSSRTKGGVLS